MKMPATILFLDYRPKHPGSMRKLDGVRRFFRTRSWDVVPVPVGEMCPETIPALLRRHRPAGCIVDCAEQTPGISKRLFGNVPVVYLDPPEPVRWRGAMVVECDNEAVARLAFEELSKGLPPCLAVVPSPSLVHWNRMRIKTFRFLCAKAGVECRVFDGLPNENPEHRIRRLMPWLAQLPRRSGVFGANDNAAGDVVEAARRIQRHIPKELSVLGVDGDFRADFAVPVSSIKLDLELAGYLAAKRLGGLAVQHPMFGPLCVFRRKSTQGPGRLEPRILEAVEIIRREAADGLSAADLAARFPGSRKHFERRFREAMGHSILDEILHVRMAKALDLLDRPNCSIGAIADFSGFGTRRELQKLFKKRYGVSMSQWRMRHL